jgi:hypothetical protein
MEQKGVCYLCIKTVQEGGPYMFIKMEWNEGLYIYIYKMVKQANAYLLIMGQDEGLFINAME